jgi:hypothetical protein
MPSITEDATDTTYNGWRNYATWVTHLWLSNDRDVLDEVTASFSDLDLLSEERRQAADRVEEYVEDNIDRMLDVLEDEPLYGLVRDLVFHADIDYDAIAEALMED